MHKGKHKGKHKNVSNLRKHVSLPDQARPVASPVAAGPSRALVEELETVLEGSLDLALALVLDPRLPLVAYQPTSHKVVVIRVQDVVAPSLRLEPFQEVVA